MSVTRRNVLRIAGSSAVIMAAGAGSFLATREPEAALAAWTADPARYADPRMRMLSYAILAPNPHNRQPWLVGLERPNEITLYCDPQRLLPETDPFGRQIVIGLGCFLELLRMAAAEEDMGAEVVPFPEGEPDGLDSLDATPIARARLTVGTARPDPLFRFVLQRRSNKEPFDPSRPVPAAVLDSLKIVAGKSPAAAVNGDSAFVQTLRDLTWQAHLKEMMTRRTLMESVDLMRIGKAEINANPDGIDLGGPMLETLSLLGLLDRQQLADPQSTAFKQGLDMYRAITGSAMAYVWLISDGNSRRDQLAAGARWLRLNLRATELGLDIHPISQALQEYPEMQDLNAQLRMALGAGGAQTVQMLGRLGYGPKVPPSPRWALESRIRTAS